MDMKKVKLQFMICPDELLTKCEVPNAVRVKIINPDAIYLTGILGESGRKMVKAGLEFYFTKSLADDFIARGIAKRVSHLTVAASPYSEKLARKYTHQILKLIFNC